LAISTRDPSQKLINSLSIRLTSVKEYTEIAFCKRGSSKTKRIEMVDIEKVIKPKTFWICETEQGFVKKDPF